MRYFFDLQGSGKPTVDTDGEDCATRAEMEQMAMKLLTEVAHGEISAGAPFRLVARVRDDQGSPVYEARLLVEGSGLPHSGSGAIAH